MIHIYRATEDDCPINLFHGRAWVRRDEVVVKTATIMGKPYTWAEPTKPGVYAFGGTLLYTNNGIFPVFNTPIKLHDRQMNLED